MRSISSMTLCAGTDGWTNRMFGDAAASVIGCEILDGIIGHLGIEARINHEAGAHHVERVTVGRRAGRGRRPGVAAGSWEIFHVDLLAPALRQLLRNKA